MGGFAIVDEQGVINVIDSFSVSIQKDPSESDLHSSKRRKITSEDFVTDQYEVFPKAIQVSFPVTPSSSTIHQYPEIPENLLLAGENCFPLLVFLYLPKLDVVSVLCPDHPELLHSLYPNDDGIFSPNRANDFMTCDSQGFVFSPSRLDRPFKWAQILAGIIYSLLYNQKGQNTTKIEQNEENQAMDGVDNSSELKDLDHEIETLPNPQTAIQSLVHAIRLKILGALYIDLFMQDCAKPDSTIQTLNSYLHPNDRNSSLLTPDTKFSLEVTNPQNSMGIWSPAKNIQIELKRTSSIGKLL